MRLLIDYLSSIDYNGNKRIPKGDNYNELW